MKSVGLVLVALVLVPLNGAGAQTARANMHVQVSVVASCSVVGGELEFGNVSELQGAHDRPHMNIDVTCPFGLPFEVGIGDGSHSHGTGQRKMARESGHGTIRYELYKSQTGHDRFGDAIHSQRVMGVGRGLRPVIVPVFGEILGNQEPPSGAYLDDSMISIYF